jgi:hypothetical protein
MAEKDASEDNEDASGNGRGKGTGQTPYVPRPGTVRVSRSDQNGKDGDGKGGSGKKG